MRILTTAGIAVAAAVAIPSPAAAVPPAPCNGVAQVSDAAGDGHHPNTDVLGAWFSEANGRLQAVIRPRVADWAPAHDDSEAAAWAMLFTQAGRVRYVRAEGPRGPARFDHGTWTAPGGFASAGATSGVTEAGGVTIDVPVTAAGTVLTDPFVLTYDGGANPAQHWVDRAPGGTAPAGSDFGADYVVGSCGGGGAPPPGGGDPGAPLPVTGVTLAAPKRVTGSRTVTVRGRIAPAQAGVSVVLTKRTRRTSQRILTTDADGGFSARVRIAESARLSASAGGLDSQTLRVVVRSRVRIAVRRLRDGDVRITGTVRPKLPGRALLIHRDAVRPRAVAQPRRGRFAFRFERLRRGRWQVVFIPSRGRALRATSNTGVVR